MSTQLSSGKLFLIPCTLSNPGEIEMNPMDVLPNQVKTCIEQLDYFIVEHSKSARKFIKSIAPEKKQADLILFELNKHTQSEEIKEMIQPLLEGKNVGIISEAGCPGIADPGAIIVDLAHKKNIPVIPLVGPSSILLALMGSGMNGQSFAFNGYLPIDKNDKKIALKNLEKWSSEKNQAQLFMETPYRNNKFLEDILNTLNGNTKLCIACDITLSTEFIKTKTVNDWKKNKVDLHNRPCIFVIQKN